MDPAAPPPASCLYRLDAGDLVTSVGGEWDAFARENGSPEAAGERVTGEPLWTFIAGPETRHVYRLLFARVRAQGRPVRLACRGDAPGERRELELLIAPLPAGGLELTARLLRSESRAPLAFLDHRAERNGRLAILCSLCKSVRMPDGDWAELDAAASRLATLRRLPPPSPVYSICARCEASVREELPG